MKVLLIHQAFVSPDQAGGTRHYEFARHCAARGDRFTIIASSLSYLTGNRIASSVTRGKDPDQDGGIRILRAYTLPALHRSFVWRVMSFISFMCSSIWAGLRGEPVDLVMGTSPPIFQAVSAWMVAAIRRRPFLLEVRDLWPEFAIDMGVLKNSILIALSRWLENFLYRRASHIIVNSPAYRDYLIGKGVPEQKVSLIPNGVDPEMFEVADERALVRKNLRLDNCFVVTYAGALGLANDIPVILRAAKKLVDQSDIHFLLIGDGKERKNLEELAKTLELRNVTFLGARPKVEMAGLLAASDACVATLQNIPMFRMTYPNKVFDYMAAGKPILLGIDGVIRKVVEECRGGIYFCPSDDDALAKAVRELCKDRSEGCRMGQRARELVLKNFDRRDHAESFRELLVNMASSSCGRADSP